MHRTILSRVTSALTDCHIQYSIIPIISWLVWCLWVCLQKRGTASVILLPANTTWVQSWMWWNCWWRSNDRYSAHMKKYWSSIKEWPCREPILPHSDSFLSLRVSSPCTHSWTPTWCVRDIYVVCHLFMSMFLSGDGWVGFGVEMLNVTLSKNRFTLTVLETPGGENVWQLPV